jgi:hypothetical protein
VELTHRCYDASGTEQPSRAHAETPSRPSEPSRLCRAEGASAQASWAAHRISSHRIASHRIASHRIASHRAYLYVACCAFCDGLHYAHGQCAAVPCATCEAAALHSAVTGVATGCSGLYSCSSNHTSAAVACIAVVAVPLLPYGPHQRLTSIGIDASLRRCARACRPWALADADSMHLSRRMSGEASHGYRPSAPSSSRRARTCRQPINKQTSPPASAAPLRSACMLHALAWP